MDIREVFANLLQLGVAVFVFAILFIVALWQTWTYENERLKRYHPESQKKEPSP